MKRIIIGVIMLLLSTNAFAYQHDKWQTHNTILEVAFIAALSIDSCQTYNALYNQKGFSENNPIYMTGRPSPKRLLSYYSFCVISHASIAYLLPMGYREAWQSIWTFLEITQDFKNYTTGARLRF